MKTNIWLRECVYKRVTPKGKKPGFQSSLATFMTSAFWVRPSHFLFCSVRKLICFSIPSARHRARLLPQLLLLRVRADDGPPRAELPAPAAPPRELRLEARRAPTAANAQEAAVRCARSARDSDAHQLRHAAVHAAHRRRLVRRVEQRRVVRPLPRRRRTCVLLPGGQRTSHAGAGGPRQAGSVPDGAGRDQQERKELAGNPRQGSDTPAAGRRSANVGEKDGGQAGEWPGAVRTDLGGRGIPAIYMAGTLADSGRGFLVYRERALLGGPFCLDWLQTSVHWKLQTQGCRKRVLQGFKAHDQSPHRRFAQGKWWVSQ